MRHLDAFSHSSSGSPNTCLRQFCERVGVPAFLTLHKTREGDTPVKEIKKYQCHIQSLPWSIITFFLHFLDFFDIFLFFLTFLHLCSGRSTYLLATAKKQADHPCNIHANIHSHIHIVLFQKEKKKYFLFFFYKKLTKFKQLQNIARIKSWILMAV